MLSNIQKSGPVLSEADVNEAEEKLGLSLPQTYKAFLLRHNGGKPEPASIDFEGEKLKLPGDEIKKFYGVGGRPTDDLIHKTKALGDSLPTGLVIIANTHGGNFFLISTRSDSYGQIFYKDHEYEDSLPFEPEEGRLPESIVFVAKDFDDFLSRLYEPDE